MSDGVVRGLSYEEYCAKMEARNMTPDGKEIPDPKPFRPSVRVERNLSMFDHHRKAMERERDMRRMMENETEDDMIDFDDDEQEEAERLSEYEREDLNVAYAQEQVRIHGSVKQWREFEANERAKAAALADQPVSAPGISSPPQAASTPDRPGAPVDPAKPGK